jgi:hypothetical protein
MRVVRESCEARISDTGDFCVPVTRCELLRVFFTALPGQYEARFLR